MFRKSFRIAAVMATFALATGSAALPAHAVAPPLALQQTFTEPGTARFGTAVALVTNTAIVGSQGKVILYQKIHNTWSRLTELVPEPASAVSAANEYGYSVDIADKIAVVGAPGASAGVGAVHVFTYSSTANQWVFKQTLSPQTPVAGGRFGESVSVSGSNILVGAAGAPTGSAYIFARASDTAPWVQADQLTGGASFGHSVSIHYGTIVVGSPDEDAGAGRARVYSVAGDGTSSDTPDAVLQQFNEAGDPVRQDGGRFGDSVTVRGTTVIVGAPGVPNGAFAFLRSGAAWAAQGQLVPPAGTVVADRFGWSVALCNDTALVGTSPVDAGKSGIAAYFTRTNDTWTYQSSVSLGAGKGAGDNYGYAVDLYCTVAAVGAPGDNAGTGTVYLHSMSEAVPIYRFYNPKTGTHFYTDSAEEREYVWRELSRYFSYEGEAYKANPGNNDQPLFRFFNFRNGSHFYTASEAEKNGIIANLGHTYRYDGPTYKVSTTPGAENKEPVWRFYNARNGSHFYTASASEKQYVQANLSHVYQLEGICFYLGK